MSIRWLDSYRDIDADVWNLNQLREYGICMAVHIMVTHFVGVIVFELKIESYKAQFHLVSTGLVF